MATRPTTRHTTTPSRARTLRLTGQTAEAVSEVALPLTFGLLGATVHALGTDPIEQLPGSLVTATFITAIGGAAAFFGSLVLQSRGAAAQRTATMAAYYRRAAQDDPSPSTIPDGTPTCDGYSVGAIITDPQGRYLLITRVKPPAGRAFVAGHIDEHGDEMAAVIAEVAEESGLTVTGMRCVRMQWLPGRCRRRPNRFHRDLGWGHQWFVFEVDTTGTVAVDESEVHSPTWVTSDELAALAARTVAYAHGRISDEQWRAEPGLEPAWVLLLAGPGLNGRPYLTVGPADRHAVSILAQRDPYPQAA